jgi:hypothetical protein
VVCGLVWGVLTKPINLPVRGQQHVAEIINLRIARKRASRQLSEKRAAAARISHGVSKADRMLAKANKDKIRRELDEHRLETGEVDEIAGG